MNWLRFRILSLVLPIPALFAAQTFIDPTVERINQANIALGDRVMVAPFATLLAGATAETSIVIGNGSNLQEDVTIDARGSKVELVSSVEVGHGATVKSGAKIGMTGVCPAAPAFCGTFIGFQAEIAEGATVEKDALVSGFARLAPGVTLPSGRKTLPGVNILTNAQALSPTHTAPMTEADRLFIQAVVSINLVHTSGYPALEASDPSNVQGINYDPGLVTPCPCLPTIGGVITRVPSFRNRSVGDVRMTDELKKLDEVMGKKISLRADEGKPLVIDEVDEMGSRTLIHTFVRTKLELGKHGTYGYRSIVHSAPDLDPADPDFNLTKTGRNFNLGAQAVFFQSQAGDDVKIGRRSFVILSKLADGTVIPPRKVVIDGVIVGTVDWE